MAAQSVPAKFLVFLAGPAIPMLPNLMMTQVSDMLSAAGASATAIQKERKIVADITTVLQNSASADEARDPIREILVRGGASRSQIRQNLDLWATEWGRHYVHYDPLPLLRAYQGPVLALYGERDLQVSAKENAPVMRSALTNPASKVTVLPRLNHLFQPAKTGQIEEYWARGITVDPSALGSISDWLLALTDNQY